MNELERTFKAKLTKVTITTTTISKTKIEDDRRYRLAIIMQRSDRPRYWTFYCHMCQYPVNEIVNADVVAESDLMDMQSLDNLMVGVRCGGRYQMKHCPMWYYFKLNNDN